MTTTDPFAIFDAPAFVPFAGTYPTWRQHHAHEAFDRTQGLAAQLTEMDRRAGLPAPAHGYSAKRFADAERLVMAAKR